MSSAYRSSLGRHAATMREPDPARALDEARKTYLASGGKIVLINAEWLPNWPDRKQLDLLAEKAFGVKGVQ